MRRRALRWLKRIALAAIALAAVALGVALLVLHTDWGRERVRRMVEAELQGSFPGARIGRLEGSVLGELVARDVELEAAGGATFVKAGVLRIELALLPLLGQAAEIERVVAEDVELYPLRTLATPVSEQEEEDPSGPPGWSVELPAIEVRRARVVIEAAPETVTLEGLDVVASVSIPAGAPISASVRITRGTWRERGAAIEGSVAVVVDGKVVTLPRLDVRVGGVAGVAVRGADVAVDPERPTGELRIDATASALARLVPGVALPGDARLAVTAARAGERELAIELDGGVGASRVTGKLRADLAALALRGVISAKGVSLAEVTRGARTGTGTAVVAVVADRARIRGTAIAAGSVDGFPAGEVVVSFDAAPDRSAAGAALASAAGLVIAAGEDGSSARGFARLSRRGGALAIDAGRLAAAAPQLSAFAGALAPVRGRVALEAGLAGTAEPLAVTAEGTLDGAGVAYGEIPADSISARRLSARFRGAATGSLAQATGQATGWIRGVADAGVPRGDADFTARLEPDRTIAAQVTARPAAAPGVVAFATARITPGETTLVALGEHAIALPGGERWRGRGGRVVIAPERVTLERLRTASGDGRLDLAATYVPETERLALSIDANAVAASSIDPAYRGLASGRIRLEQRGTRWDGTIALDGRGLAFAPDAAPLDADLRVEVAGRRVKLASTARTAALGGVRFDLDVDGPADLTDVDGWRLLPRAAVRSARLGVDRADLAAAAVPTGGVVDGTLYIAGADTTGTMKVRGVRTPLGDVEGDITFRPEDQGQLGATSTVHVSDLGDADVSARIAFPAHPFDPEAWAQLGRGALAHLGASLSDLAIDPDRLAALGIDAPYRGLADIAVVVTDGGRSAIVDATVTGASGGPIVQPLDLHVTAMVDPRGGTRVRGNVHDTREPERTMLASFEAAVPSFDVDRWLAAPDQARHAPIAGGLVTLPGLRGLDGKRPAFPLRAPVLLAVFGRDDLAAGTILGTVAVGGTLGTPTAKADLALAGLQVARRVPGKPAPGPTDLTIDARWGGASGRVTITGKSAGGQVVAWLEGDPTDRARLAGSVTATGFDVAPLAAFLPGDLHAIEGKLDARLAVRGLDSLARLRGSLEVKGAAIPLDPMLGKLRDATARATIDDRRITLDAAGALGGGKVTLRAESEGHELAAIAATARLDDVSPLGEWEPVIDADVEARLRRGAADQWTGTIAVRNGVVVLPPSGSDLGDPDRPSDLLFVEDGQLAPPRAPRGGQPARPWLVADIELEPIRVKAEDLFDTRGDASGRLRLEVGDDDLALTGRVDIENGMVGDLFGRQYAASGHVAFSRSLEPDVHIRLEHKFPQLTLTVRLDGDPATLTPVFESDSPIYTSDQLAGFFIGGEPGGDPSAQTREAATGAGAAVLSSTLGTRIRKRLPIKIEQLGCDPGNSVTAASCTVGRWFGEKLFVAFKRRIETQDEAVNANEVQGQYYLRRDLYLERVGGDAGSGGLDLLWRRRW